MPQSFHLQSPPNEVKTFETNTISVKEVLPVLHSLNQPSPVLG